MQVAPSNVIIQFVTYADSDVTDQFGHPIPEAQTVGTGSAWVFTGGVMITGTWTRGDRLQPFQLKDTDGNVIALTPGRTWVELSRIFTMSPLT